MSPRVRDGRRRWLRWLVPGALVALAPKCVLCVAAYVGVGTSLGWTGAEICGAGGNEAMHGFTWLAIGGVALVAGALLVRTWGPGVGRRIDVRPKLGTQSTPRSDAQGPEALIPNRFYRR